MTNYASTYWKLRLPRLAPPDMTRRRYARWRRFINSFRRAVRNAPGLTRSDAWEIFSNLHRPRSA